jgi:tetratricopeptide (TPR) repeat protein
VRAKLNSIVKKTVLLAGLLLLTSASALYSQSIDEMNKLRIAQALENAGEFDRASAVYKQLYDANPSNIVFFDGLRRAYMNLKEYNLAENLIRKQIATDPKNVTLYCQLGDAFYKGGDSDSAAASWKSAIDAGPGNPGTYLAVAEVMIQNRLFEKAIEVYKEGETATNSKSGFVIQIARLYFYNMNYKESVRELLKLFDSDNSTSAMAYIQSQLGSYSTSKEAVDQFTGEMEKQVRENSDNLYYRQILAFLYMEQKNYPAAYDVYKWLDEQEGAKGIELLAFAERAYNAEAFESSAGAYREVSRLSKTPAVIAQAVMGYANSLRRLGERLNADDDQPCASGDTLNTLKASLAAYGEIIDKYPGTQYLAPAVINSVEIEMNYFRDFTAAERLYSAHANFTEEYAREASLLRVRLFMMEGKFDDALKESVGQLKPVMRNGGPLLPSDAYVDGMKFEAARALYYLGDFDSASTLLGQIISNPMSDAANEAIQLVNLISNNKGIPGALKEYAKAGAYEIEGRMPEAAAQLAEVVNSFPQAPLSDNAKFDLAAAYCGSGNVAAALKWYSSLASDSLGIFADRAQFRMARIYQFTLHDTTGAIRQYETFLVRFPNSIYQDRVRGILKDLLGNNS